MLPKRNLFDYKVLNDKTPVTVHAAKTPALRDRVVRISSTSGATNHSSSQNQGKDTMKDFHTSLLTQGNNKSQILNTGKGFPFVTCSDVGSTTKGLDQAENA